MSDYSTVILQSVLFAAAPVWENPGDEVAEAKEEGDFFGGEGASGH